MRAGYNSQSFEKEGWVCCYFVLIDETFIYQLISLFQQITQENQPEGQLSSQTTKEQTKTAVDPVTQL